MARQGWELYESYSHMHPRVALWEVVLERTRAKRVLYPGSFVDVSPSFVFDHVTYLDLDRRCASFFADPEVRRRVPHGFDFQQADYLKPLDVGTYDLLLSQFAGPISHYMGHHVSLGGYLLCNDSHADASIAHQDQNWELVAVLHGTKFSVQDLETYFVRKRGEPPSVETLIDTQKPPNYRVVADNYLFQRIGGGPQRERS